MKWNLSILIFAVIFCYNVKINAQDKLESSFWSVNPGLTDYSLDSNRRERTTILTINFKIPFEKKPGIFISISQIDADRETNLRYNVEVISISRDAFTLRVRTWSDSRIFSLSSYQ